MNTPFFSIVIPLYNKEPYIAKTLESVLAQQFGDFEVIVVNDGSTDKSPELVQTYVERDKRITLINQENGHVSRARNHGIQKSQGQYVAFIDADDYWEPDHLVELKALADAFPEAGLLGTAYQRIYPNERPVAVLHRRLSGRRQLVDYFEKCLPFQFIYTSCIAIQRKLLEAQKVCFQPGVKRGEDLSLWARIAMQTQTAYSAKVTVNYNCDDGGSLVRTASQDSASVEPVLTLGALVQQSRAKGIPHPYLQRYADLALFHRALRVCVCHSQPVQDYLCQTNAVQWTRSKRVKLLHRLPSKPFWKAYWFLHRCFNSMLIQRLKDACSAVCIPQSSC